VCRRRKAGHVETNFGHDDLSREFANPRDRGELDDRRCEWCDVRADFPIHLRHRSVD
jgi:hypothetical protein